MLEQLNLSDIQAFVKIARLGSFSKAAEALEVSRSHVSRQLSQLEKKLAVTLIIRTTRSQQLTDAGKALLVECESALNRIDQALQHTIAGNSDMQGLIRINSIGGYIGERIISPLVAEFMLKYPDIHIELDFSSHRVDLLLDQFDIVFRMGSIPDGLFIAKPLGEISMVTAASPDYLAKHGTLEHPQILADESHRCIVGSVTTWFYQHARSSEMLEVNVHPALTCKNGHVMVQSAKAGLGIIRVPALYCQDEIDAGNLLPIFTDWTIPSVPFSLLYHQDKYRPQRLQVMIDFIKEQRASLVW